MKKLIVSLSLLVSVVSLGQDGFDFTEYCYSNNKQIVKEVSIDSLENVLLQKINILRRENGLNSLNRVNILDQYSENWSHQMVNKSKINHSELSQNNITAENVYLSKSFGVFPMEKKFVTTVAQRIFDSWLSSEGHKNNMLNKDVKNIGISILLLPDGMIDVSSTMVVN